MMIKALTVDLKSFKDRPREIIRTAAENWRLLLLAALFVCGLLSGAVLCGGSTEIEKLIGSFAEKMFTQTVSRNFTLVFTANACLTIIVLLSGLSVVGLPAVLVSPCAAGAIVGAVSSFFYLTYRLDGVIFSLIIIFPAAAIVAVMLIIGCNEAAILSGVIAGAAFSSGIRGRGELKAYFLRFGIIIAVICLCSLVQAACISGFGAELLI